MYPFIMYSEPSPVGFSVIVSSNEVADSDRNSLLKFNGDLSDIKKVAMKYNLSESDLATLIS